MEPGRSDAQAASDLSGQRQPAAQQAYRLVNESIDALQTRFGPLEALELLCECGDPTCSQRALIPHDSYTAVRSHPRRFVFAADHPLAVGEWVVEERPGYLVVEVAQAPPLT